MDGIDNFINYCDKMMIATEGVKEGFQKMKAWLIKQFNRILDWLTKMIKKLNPKSKIRSKMLKMIAKAKTGLSKSKSLNAQNPELAERLKSDVEELQEESLTIEEELKKELDEVDRLFNETENVNSDSIRKENINILNATDEELRTLRDIYLSQGRADLAKNINDILNTKDMNLRTLRLKRLNLKVQTDITLNYMDSIAKRSSAYADVAHKFSKRNN